MLNDKKVHLGVHHSLDIKYFDITGKTQIQKQRHRNAVVQYIRHVFFGLLLPLGLSSFWRPVATITSSVLKPKREHRGWEADWSKK